MSASLPDDVRSALDAGNKIAAIRLLRQHTGLGLKQAQAAVEAGHLPAHALPATDSPLAPPTAWPAADTNGLPANAAAALAAGQKVKAIMIVCAEKSIGLKEAKALVDAASRGLAPKYGARSSSGLAPGEVPHGRFGSLALLVAVLMLVVLVWRGLSAD